VQCATQYRGPGRHVQEIRGCVFFKQRQGRFLCCPVSPQCLTGRSHFSNRALHSVAPVHCEIVVREAAPGPRLCVQGKFDRRRQRERKFMVAKSFVIRKLGDSR